MTAKVESQVLRVDSSREIHVVESVPIIAKSVEVDQVEITFDEPADWSTMGLEIWFANSYDKNVAKRTWNGSDPVIIPASVTQSPGWLGLAIVGTITTGSGQSAEISQRGVTKLAQNLMRIYESMDGIGAEVDPDEESEAASILDQVLSAQGAAVTAAGQAVTAAAQAQAIAEEIGHDFTGATASAAGAHGLVPAPAAGEDTYALTGDGTWGVDLNDKADIDGYYELLTAGAADNLTGRGDSVEGSFLYRTAGGDADIADGIATIECIRGNTVGWNQLCNNKRLFSYTAFDSYMTGTNSTNLVEWECTADGLPLDASSRWCGGFDMNCSDYWCFIPGHKYIFGCEIKTSVANIPFGMSSRGRNYGTETQNGGTLNSFSSSTYPKVTQANVWTKFRHYYEPTDYRNSIAIYVSGTNEDASVITAGTTWAYRNFQIFDLTQMFGAGNEPSTVEEFEALYPEHYYPTDLGTLKPVAFEGIETVGFNAYDPSVGTAAVISGNVYQISGTYTALAYSDGTAITPDPSGHFTPDRSDSIVVTGGNSTDTCVHLVWSGYRDGEYEEYWKAQREIAIAQYFPTGMKAAGTAADALYKDHADTVVGVIADLSTLNWTISGNGSRFYVPVEDSPAVSTWATIGAKLSTSRYTLGAVGNVTTEDNDRMYSFYNKYLYIRDTAYDNVADFKASLAGVSCYYELATPTTEVIDPPLNLGYRVSDFGTERVMLGDGVISAPPIFEISYGLNAVDTIRRLPTEYISENSFGEFLDAAYGAGTVTQTWDAVNNRYSYTVAELDEATIAAVVDEEWRD